MRRTRWLASGLLLVMLGAAVGCGNELESPTADKLRGLEGFVLRLNGLDPDNLEAAFVSERALPQERRPGRGPVRVLSDRGRDWPSGTFFNPGQH